ncbi:hypothetical protein MMC11_003552 [Xylographa trunciseda]|nr:hypothetical protein [Xylographa trunciseda]
MHTHILQRFRSHCPRQPALPWPSPRAPSPRLKPKPKPTLTTTQHTALLHQARHLLSTLSRANAGHLAPLSTVLAHTYGRTGRRRHELLAAATKLDVPRDQREGARQPAASLTPGESTTTSTSTSALPRMVELLMKAQRAQRGARLSRAPMKTLRAPVPAANSWGRAVPAGRARNIEARWRAKALRSVLPPLPRGEWERLRDLATGRRAWGGGVVRRRGRAVAERVRGENPHRVTGRFMRRLWGRVLVQCPVVEWEGEGGRWVVRWGGGRWEGRVVEVEEEAEAEAGRGDLFCFEGVDDDGRRLGLR